MQASLKSRCWLRQQQLQRGEPLGLYRSGTWSSAEAAGVPGRGEYLNENA